MEDFWHYSQNNLKKVGKKSMLSRRNLPPGRKANFIRYDFSLKADFFWIKVILDTKRTGRKLKSMHIIIADIY